MTTLAFVSLLARSVAFALLLRVAWTDLKYRRIANRDVLVIALCGLSVLAGNALAGGSWMDFGIAAGASALVFLALFPFWLMKTLGAGDVKLMAAAPLVAGSENLLLFALLLFFLSLVAILLLKNPLLLPPWAFRGYLQALERQGVVPYGVPISAALMIVLVLQAAGATPLI